MIGKFALTGGEELIVVFDCLRALLQTVVGQCAEEEVTGALSAQGSDALEGGQSLRILFGDHQDAGQFAPRFDRIGFEMRGGYKLRHCVGKLTLVAEQTSVEHAEIE